MTSLRHACCLCSISKWCCSSLPGMPADSMTTSLAGHGTTSQHTSCPGRRCRCTQPIASNTARRNRAPWPRRTQLRRTGEGAGLPRCSRSVKMCLALVRVTRNIRALTSWGPWNSKEMICHGTSSGVRCSMLILVSEPAAATCAETKSRPVTKHRPG